MCRIWRKTRKAFVSPYLKLFAKRKAAYYFLTYVPACSPNYTDEEWKSLQSIPKQYAFD